MRIPRENRIKTWRILEIDRMIRDGGYPDVRKLAGHFEVSRATICRDIEFLRDFYHAPLEFDRTRHGYFYSDASYSLQKLNLTEGELFTISIVYPLLRQYKNTPIEKNMLSLFDKITDLLPGEVTVDASFLSGEISLISDPLPAIDRQVFECVLQALKSRRRLSFHYTSGPGAENGTDAENRRSALPYHVVCHRGNWYMLAFCRRHQEIRTFAFARISAPRLEEERFTVPEDFDPGRYLDTMLGVWDSKPVQKTAEIRFSPSVARYIEERSWHENQTIRREDSGAVILSFPISRIRESAPWILGFGPLAQVLAPPELAAEIRRQAAETAALYDSAEPSAAVKP